MVTILLWRRFCCGSDTVVVTIVLWRRFCCGRDTVVVTIISNSFFKFNIEKIQKLRNCI